VSSMRRSAETVRTVPGIFGTRGARICGQVYCACKPLCTALPPGGLQNSTGVAAFWLGRPFAQTTAICVRFVTPNLRMICRT
jgi:hypothetical protein